MFSGASSLSIPRVIGALLALKLGTLGAAEPRTFDPGVDFSPTENPHGVWQYGYSETASLAPDQFRLDRHTSAHNDIAFWEPAGDSAGHYPYIAFNKRQQLQAYVPGSWAVRAGEVAMEGSNTGQYSLLRFLAPYAGTYRVSAQFAGLHTGGDMSSTDVHVLQDGKSLFSAFIEGYGGDESFHEVRGQHPRAAFAGELRLEKGASITFAVGYGRNKTHSCDTTGLRASITLVSEEART